MKEKLFGDLEMEFPEGQFLFSTDSMVLADFAVFPKGSKICDLGCGCGTLAILTAAKDASFEITGVEILEEPAALAAQNVRRNGLAERIRICNADLRDRAVLPASFFDGVICNPPYYPISGGKVSKEKALAAARSEENCTLPELTAVCGRILKYGGRCFFVYKPERLCDLFVALRENGLEPKRLQFVRHSAKKPISLVLVEARRGGKGGLSILEDLILHNPDGSPSAAYRRIYHQEETG